MTTPTPLLDNLLSQAPLVALVLYLWREAAVERREWRSWFEQQQRDLSAVIERNTQALLQNTSSNGAVAAIVSRCDSEGGNNGVIIRSQHGS